MPITNNKQFNLLQVIKANPRRTTLFIGLVVILVLGTYFVAHDWSYIDLGGRISIPIVESAGAIGGFGALFFGFKKTLRMQLHERYIRANRNQALKVKPLKVKQINSQDELEALQVEMEKWATLSEKCVGHYKVLNRKLSQREIEERERFNTCRVISLGVKKKINSILHSYDNEYRVQAIYDEKNVLQAVCIFNKMGEDKWNIELLVSAPHNLESTLPTAELDKKACVKGAGAALIAEVIFANQRTSLMEEAMPLLERRTVQLTATISAHSFYKHIGFEFDKDNTFAPCVLKGEKLTTFLNNYGGRVIPA